MMGRPNFWIKNWVTEQSIVNNTSWYVKDRVYQLQLDPRTTGSGVGIVVACNVHRDTIINVTC